MTYSKEAQDRMKKIQDLKDAGVIPYANHFNGKQNIADIREQESQVKDAAILMSDGAEKTFKTAGRIVLSRGMGKLLFAKIRDNSADIQVCFMKWALDFFTGKENVQEIEVWWETKTAFLNA